MTENDSLTKKEENNSTCDIYLVSATSFPVPFCEKNPLPRTEVLDALAQLIEGASPSCQPCFRQLLPQLLGTGGCGSCLKALTLRLGADLQEAEVAELMKHMTQEEWRGDFGGKAQG